MLVCSLLCILDLGEDGHLDNDLWRFEKITDRVMYSDCEIGLRNASKRVSVAGKNEGGLFFLLFYVVSTPFRNRTWM